MAKIAIIGAGGFGISLAIAAHQNHHDVTVWISQKKSSAQFSGTENIRQNCRVFRFRRKSGSHVIRPA